VYIYKISPRTISFVRAVADVTFFVTENFSVGFPLPEGDFRVWQTCRNKKPFSDALQTYMWFCKVHCSEISVSVSALIRSRSCCNMFKSKEENREAKIIISAGVILPKPSPNLQQNTATEVNLLTKNDRFMKKSVINY
jgi:hypothetical protein